MKYTKNCKGHFSIIPRKKMLHFERLTSLLVVLLFNYTVFKFSFKVTIDFRAEKLLQNINKIYEGVVDLTSDEKDPDAEILSESSDDEVIFGDFMNDEELEDLKATNDCMFICLIVCLMMFSTTFNNISIISWESVLLLEETGGPGENHLPVKSLTNFIT